jgi:nucleoside-triphosphatase
VIETSVHGKIASRNLFVTGPPRCGKSTFIEKVVRNMGRPATGFFTREIREAGARVGFSLTTLDGKTGILAHKWIKSRFKVGRYGVNLGDLERIAVPSMIPSGIDQVVVIDEVGKMECFSPLFKETLVRVLDSENTVIGSITVKGDRFIQRIRERPDLKLIYLNERNRDCMVDSFLKEYLI